MPTPNGPQNHRSRAAQSNGPALGSPPLITSSHHPLTAASAANTPSLPPTVPPSSAAWSPICPPPQFDQIPDQLRRANRWALWRIEHDRGDRYRKMLFTPSGQKATRKDSQTWTPFSAVASAFERSLRKPSPYDGVAFALGDGFASIILFNVLDDGGTPLPWAARFVAEFATYTEIDPDGRSLAIIFQGPLPTSFGARLGPFAHPEGGTIEIACDPRFVTVTGRRWPENPRHQIEHRQSQFQQFAVQLRSGIFSFPNQPTAGIPSDVAAAVPSRSGVPAAVPSRPAIPNHESSITNHEPETPSIPSSHHPFIDSGEADPPSLSPSIPPPSSPAPLAPSSPEELINFVMAEFRFGRTRAGETFLVDRSAPGVARTFRRNSDALRDILVQRVLDLFNVTPPPAALNVAQSVIFANLTQAPPEDLALRVAKLPLAPVFRGEGPGVRGTSEASAPPNEEQDQAPSHAQQHNKCSAAGLPPFISSSPHLFIHNSRDSEPQTRNASGIVLDLGRSDGQTVIITADGWRIVDRSPVLFRRTALTDEMPIPERGARLDLLRTLLNVTDDGWPLLRGWLVAALFPTIPHPVLLLGGIEGTGKSTALRILTSLVDPSPAPLRTEPLNLEQWAVTASSGWCFPLDNMSSIPIWLSDAMCKAVTGDGFIRRKFHTDDDLTVLSFRRVIALSSIDLGALRGDLAQRLLLVDFDPIDDRSRQTDEEMLEAFEQLKPLLLGALLDEVVTALRHLPSVRLKELPRMADFAKILAALDLADVAAAVPSRPTADAGNAVPGGPSASREDAKDAKDAKDARDARSGLALYLAQSRRLAEEVVEADGLGTAIVHLVETNGVWEGTASELQLAIAEASGDSEANIPKLPHVLSRRLRRLTSALNVLGVTIDFQRVGGFERQRRIRLQSRRLAQRSDLGCEASAV